MKVVIRAVSLASEVFCFISARLYCHGVYFYVNIFMILNIADRNPGKAYLFPQFYFPLFGHHWDKMNEHHLSPLFITAGLKTVFVFVGSNC